MSDVTFKRGQVEWALWRALTIGRGFADQPPAVFRTRIKRLLDLDRDNNADEPAFAPHGEGQGVELQFTPFDVFCLGIGLDLLDIGFKQGEVVQLIRHLRPELEGWLPHLLARPSLIDRQNHLARQHPDLPTVERKGRAPLADSRVFLVLGRIEATEALVETEASGGEAALLAPIFCAGLDRLREAILDLMPLRRRVAAVLEITAMAQAVDTFLAKAPTFARGRPKRAGL
ncbi:MAG: hypothetical protein JNM89_03745 [Hyphomicrobiaceae bacterium]|nr:hypothetical protein [Hyphomicrobiaceae bacterium]